MNGAVFEDAQQLVTAIKSDNYDMNMLYAFKERYIENVKGSNAQLLAKFIVLLMK
jgi:hypothetical protein